MKVLHAAALAAVLAIPASAAELKVPEGGYAVSDDLSQLPAAVRKTRDDLLAAARSGDMEELRKIFDRQPAPVNVSFGAPPDPIEFLKGESADKQGLETLAILADLMLAPYAAFDQGDGDLGYVWPYLAWYEDISKLTPGETVDAYRIMGHDKFEEMRGLEAWYYWRVYIGAQGDLTAFVAGD